MLVTLHNMFLWHTPLVTLCITHNFRLFLSSSWPSTSSLLVIFGVTHQCLSTPLSPLDTSPKRDYLRQCIAFCCSTITISKRMASCLGQITVGQYTWLIQPYINVIWLDYFFSLCSSYGWHNRAWPMGC